MSSNHMTYVAGQRSVYTDDADDDASNYLLQLLAVACDCEPYTAAVSLRIGSAICGQNFNLEL